MNVKESPLQYRDRKSKSRPFLHLCWWIEVLLLVVSLRAAAEDLVDPEERGDGTIEVIYPKDITQSYRARKTDWGKNISLSMQTVRPENYTSVIGLPEGAPVETYDYIFGTKDIDLFTFGLGLQYNTEIGSFTADLSGGMGSVLAAYDIGNRTLTLVKRGVSVGFTFNNIFEEPYIAPYANLEIFNFQYKDELGDDSDIGSTAMTLATTVGILVQLNHLDTSTAAHDANIDWGIENTFIDIYATQYGLSSSSDDPDLSTSFNLGIGLKIEL